MVIGDVARFSNLLKEHANSSRKLSPAEAKRQLHFVEYCNTLLSQGYKQKTITMSISKANKFAFVLNIPIIVVLAIPFFLMNQFGFFSTSFIKTLFIFVPVTYLLLGVLFNIFSLPKDNK